MTAPTFGQLLRDARHDAGLTLAELARRMNEIGYNLRDTTISDYERDRRTLSAQRILDFAAVLGCDPIELLSAAGHIHPTVTAALRNPIYHRNALDLARSFP